MAKAHKLSENWIHLGLGATAETQPPFDGMQWYEAYEQRSKTDGREGRLVSMHSFSADWESWELHPLGSEIVVCTAGAMTLIQQTSAATLRIDLNAGEYAINAPGVWHTAEVEENAEALFITAGQGTEHKAR